MFERDREVRDDRDSRVSRKLRERRLAKERRAERRIRETRKVWRSRDVRRPVISGITTPQTEPDRYKPSATVIIVNHNTNALMSRAIVSMRRVYPAVQMLIVDNGSTDGSVEHIMGLASRNTRYMLLSENIGHGPALHLGVLECCTRLVFTLDTDTEVIRGGFFEKLEKLFENFPNLFAAGWLRYVNFNGVPYPNQGSKNGYKYIHPCAMMMDRGKYLRVEPFKSKGAPAIRTMISAVRDGYDVVDFPILEHIDHLGAGTRRMYGGEWDPRSINKRDPKPWNPNESYRV